ncbi:MAG: hypothetical protein U1F48_10925 [Burkholderiales bacterium]
MSAGAARAWCVARTSSATPPDADHELGRLLTRIHPAPAAPAPERSDGRPAVVRAA